MDTDRYEEIENSLLEDVIAVDKVLTTDVRNDFESIHESERLHPNKDICGIMKVHSLCKDPSEFSLEASHDVIFLMNPESLRDDITEDDIRYLLRCGVAYRPDCDCLVISC